MPNTVGRQRAPAPYHGKPRHDGAPKARRDGAPGARRGGASMAQRDGGRNKRRTARPAGPARSGGNQPSELDLALAAAARLPQPPATTFAELGLDARIVRALAARDIVVPFAIQARALPDALGGRDVLGRAETGSGKTLAFGLPMLSRVADLGGRRRAKAPLGLVLVPTRELAEQVADVLRPIGRSLGLLITTVYGGVSIARQVDRLGRGVDVVVATPGRLIDLMGRQACTLDDVEVTVIDEADHMADLGFLPSVTQIMDATPHGGQRMLFSATLDRGVDRLVGAYLTDPALHAVEAQVEAASAAEHSLFVVDPGDKLAVATELAGRPSRTLFFVRTKHGADRLARQLGNAGVEAAAIHGDRNQNQRQRALDAFTAGHPRVLVATDVAARGIHVDGIELVIHFDPPNDHKDYLHRSGRTARAGASGLVVMLAQAEQVRDLRRMYQAAGVEPAAHEAVTVRHHAVRQIATTGTPVPPPPPQALRPRPADAPARVRPRRARQDRAVTTRSRPAAGPRPVRASRPERPRSRQGEG
jgi:superfamily II DNA/RNA helicase